MIREKKLNLRIRANNIKHLECTVYDILKRAELFWITGRSRHPKADEKTQEAF